MFLHNTKHFTIIQQDNGEYVLWSRDLDRPLFMGPASELLPHLVDLTLELDEIHETLGTKETS
jgi:hypothetical protein